ncbi:MAG: anthranilate phosphoribosyltransferase [Candidatus Dadabacteria bacterium]|nr:anthranilate phosphoribosyltransferase [Candidatus Dadabacteria bacterium]MYE61484.1 anthranilate phosphoribosyltransferase [Candidatus Dadabacteria bacterium]MYI73217.1 anthranilate phosphoribosyltransferase [Candidatus Dadabacteria bacterium]
MITEVISKLVEGGDLSEKEVAAVFDLMMEGELPESQMAAFLTALRMKGETVSEITGVAKALLGKAEKIDCDRETAVDLCGTGGDGSGTFNISTTAAFIVSGAGVTVAKHGNRSVSSPVGSADVLEALGVKIGISPSLAQKCLSETGIAFLFAPVYHPAMRNVAKCRKELGIRTVFNLIGPVVNPAGVKNQVMGVYSPQLLVPVAEVLKNLGSQKVMVVHGEGCMDEITVTGSTKVAELRDGEIAEYDLHPEDFGVKTGSQEELRGGASAAENAEITLSVLRGGENGAKTDASLLNAMAAIYVSGKAASLAEALALAKDSLLSGAALGKLEMLIEITNRNQPNDS